MSDKPKRRWAIYTIVREESYYLPKWYKYYSQFLDDCDLHIIHHVPDPLKPSETEQPAALVVSKRDDCCDFLNGKDCKIYVETEPYFSARWIHDVAQKYQSKLLEDYEAVIFTDVDEIIVPRPESGFDNLGDFMLDFVADAEAANWRVTAYSLIHMPDRGEKVFDYGKSIMSQRMYWYRDAYYDKPLVSKVALEWSFGFHTAKNVNAQPHPNLILIHLHQFDLDWYIKRHLRWAKEYAVPDEDKRSTHHSHYRQSGVDALLQQYYHFFNSDDSIIPTLIERWVRDRLNDII